MRERANLMESCEKITENCSKNAQKVRARRISVAEFSKNAYLCVQ